MKGRSKILSALLAAALFVGATIPALAANETGGEETAKATAKVEITPDANAGTVTANSDTYYVGGSVTLASGQQVDLTAAPKSGYKFSGWKYGSTTQSDAKLTVTYEIAKANSVITAAFDKIAATSRMLKVSITPANSGTVTNGGSAITGDIEVVENGTVTLAAKANTGYEFVKWTLNGKDTTTASLTVNYSELTAETTTVTATFKATTTTDPENPGTTDPTTPEEPTTENITLAVGNTYWVESGNKKTVWTVNSTGSVTILTADGGCKIYATSPTTSPIAVTGTVDGKVVKTVNVTIVANAEPDEVVDKITGLDSNAIEKMTEAQATTTLEEIANNLEPDEVAKVAEKLGDEDVANLDALMKQSNGIQIGGATVNVTVDAPKPEGTIPDAEQVKNTPKFTGLSLLAIKERAEITMKPTQRPASTFKKGNLKGRKLWIDLELKMKKGGKESTYTGTLPKYVKIELTVPTAAANSKFMNIFHSDNTSPQVFEPSNATNIVGRNYFTKKDNGNGTTTITFYLRKFSDVVFSDEAAKSTSTSTSYSGGGGGGAGFSSYVITATAGAGGSISSPGETRYNAGTSVTYTITPNAGYVVDKVLVDGKKEVALTNGTYTFRLLDQPYTISATFKPVSGGTAAQPSAPAAAAPNPSTGDSWFTHLFF